MENLQNKDGVIRGNFISYEDLDKNGFDRNEFSYYVDATIKLKHETVVLRKCKTIDIQEEGSQIFYFSEGDDGILLFRKEDNPNMTIKRLLLN